jgi:hypothetical protein
MSIRPGLDRRPRSGSWSGSRTSPRFEEACAAFEAAAELAGNRREQELLKRRAAEAADAAMPPP